MASSPGQTAVSADGRSFICGVVEGFYGRPWTSEQRKELFSKLKKWGMNSYVYAPKDDCKHRAYWRSLYTVEEADLLTSLISAAKEHGITFYYALSPGLDMTYSSAKETAILRRKLEQVAQFGCEAFALLFDDIESEMSEPDKEMFQSFAHAQVAVTNDVYNHLGAPRFLFCPTQYCSTRAVPNVTRSDYLSTIGNKLVQDIDILWTGSKVITKILTTENIEEIAGALKRPPLIWDNLHANDYDQKRVFLGPYSGRDPKIIPLLRGVLTNPNCEFHMNTIAIHTLALWSKCSENSFVDVSLSADVKLETETEDDAVEEEIPKYISNNVYHPKRALRTAVCDWIPEFSVNKLAHGPVTKPQPQVTMVMPIIPIIPSINTCMSLTTPTTASTTTTTSFTPKLPELNTNELQSLAEVCSNIVPNTALPSPGFGSAPESMGLAVATTTVVSSGTSLTMSTDVTSGSGIIATPLPNLLMNSLVSPTKIITDEPVLNPIMANVAMPDKLPVACLPPPVSEQRDFFVPAMDQYGSEKELAEPIEDEEPMEECTQTVSLSSPKHPSSLKSDDVVMTENSSGGSGMAVEDINLLEASAVAVEESNQVGQVTVDDLHLLCDLFYLPFEHGTISLVLLSEFHWLKNNASVLVVHDNNKSGSDANKPEAMEWSRRAAKFEHISQRVFELARKLVRSRNQEIVHELYSYLWELTSVLELLVGYVRWLKLGQFPANINNFTQGSYTWFSKGWKESFMSGDQEPWVFRGGLVADLQRLIPVDNGNDLFLYKFPDQPNDRFMSVRPYIYSDEEALSELWSNYTFGEWGVERRSLPECLQSVSADCIVGPFVTISPAFTLVIENGEKSTMTGFICGAPDAKQFDQSSAMCWWPSMAEKYPKEAFTLDALPDQVGDALKWCAKRIHNSSGATEEVPEDVLAQFPAVMVCCVWPVNPQEYFSLAKRLATVLFAALRSHGSFGVHTWIEKRNGPAQEFYSKLGFNLVYEDVLTGRSMLGRKF